MRMIATKAQTYDRKTLAAGDEFEVADQYVATLVSLGRARPADDPSTATEPVTTDKRTYKTRRLKADD